MRVRLKPVSRQVIVITGASSGIGLATAERAVDEGAAVVLAARNEAALAEIEERLRARGGRVATVVGDVSVEADIDRIVEAAVKQFGGFDTWVNDAAAALYGRHVDTPVEDHRRVFEVGYWGTVHGSMAAVQHLRTRGGALINIGSVLSERAMILQGAYSAMKHAVRGFTDSLRMEVEADGLPISVTLIKPTGMNTPYPEHARNRMGAPARIPPVVYDPRLVAKAVLFAAAHPKRELTVGGNGLMISKLGNLMPRSTDLAMEAGGEKVQQIDQPPPSDAYDNLYEPRADGRIDSDQDIYVRRTSLWLEAQMRPAITSVLLGGLGLAALAVSNAAPRRMMRRLRGGRGRQLDLPLRGARHTGYHREAAE